MAKRTRAPAAGGNYWKEEGALWVDTSGSKPIMWPAALALLLLPAVAVAQDIHIPYSAGSIRVEAGAGLEQAPPERPGAQSTTSAPRLSFSQSPPALGDAWTAGVAIPAGLAGMFNLTVESLSGPLQGITAISINGTVVATLDCYASAEGWRMHTVEAVG